MFQKVKLFGTFFWTDKKRHQYLSAFDCRFAHENGIKNNNAAQIIPGGIFISSGVNEKKVVVLFYFGVV